MKPYLVIADREIRSYFSTPIALIFLTVFLILCGVFTFKIGQFYETGQCDLGAFFLWHPWLYLFIVPAISMRLWAEERRSGTIEFLLTLPVSITDSMIGKFIASWAFIGLALLLTFPLVISILFLGQPDLGVILASYIGSFLMAGAFLAIGCAVSACTNNQVISFVLSTAVCLALILIGFEPVTNVFSRFLPQAIANSIVNLSFPYHFESIQRGVLDLTDIIFFISLIFLSLYSGIIIIDRKKAE